MQDVMVYASASYHLMNVVYVMEMIHHVQTVLVL